MTNKRKKKRFKEFQNGEMSFLAWFIGSKKEARFEIRRMNDR